MIQVQRSLLVALLAALEFAIAELRKVLAQDKAQRQG